jgi:hypothetical protein
MQKWLFGQYFRGYLHGCFFRSGLLAAIGSITAITPDYSAGCPAQPLTPFWPICVSFCRTQKARNMRFATLVVFREWCNIFKCFFEIWAPGSS